MWFELATVLGGTVEELQRRMLPAEFSKWLKYRNTFGPLDFVRRYDRPAALAAVLVQGGKMQDFLPYPIRHYSEAERFARELMGHG